MPKCPRTSIILAQSYRKKYDLWFKKYQVHEALQLEFEVACETNASLTTWLGELNDKMVVMTDFKKLWLRFVMLTEVMMKKDDILPGFSA